ncbi:hypothetical protein Pm5460_01 [Proteus phage vB_PmiP_Pm5460]|uniref:Uncharacterized protein n=1 Tax=Proteus phage vB_PmiP_Pm5460 TaxID=1636249 RepID=A0A0G2SSS9_9CAUD|nr:hypothetical protein AVT60_gp01 [Proteus phage vB_PmiP_Pm5460]AKA61810.1 hypothetical protein Pm5460_01 [Proteus phage vB_PmiP_Pm5460]
MKLNKMRTTAKYAMCYGARYETFEAILLAKKAKKRYIKKAWKQAKADLANMRSYGTPKAVLRGADRIMSYRKVYSGDVANFIIFDEVQHAIH